jgi:hypothetical protein
VEQVLAVAIVIAIFIAAYGYAPRLAAKRGASGPVFVILALVALPASLWSIWVFMGKPG